MPRFLSPWLFQENGVVSNGEILFKGENITTALDVVVQDKILNQIKEIQKETKSSMVFITHDISVVSELCETIVVMY